MLFSLIVAKAGSLFNPLSIPLAGGPSIRLEKSRDSSDYGVCSGSETLPNG